MFNRDFPYKYCPILSISPSETTALKELPDKDKDLILPIFPIKSWATAKELSSSIERVELSIGTNRKWIADIDHNDLLNRPKKKFRKVHHDIEKMMNSENGYKNWCDFISEHPNVIPCLQLKDLAELSTQTRVLASFNRGVVVILNRSHLESDSLDTILNTIRGLDNLLVMVDLGHITFEQVGMHDRIEQYIKNIKRILPNALISLSSSSFPDYFGGYYKGTISIHDRSLFDRISRNIDGLIYSDRGGARATKLSGGGGTPPPRIDYATRNEWQFIRMEFEETADMEDGPGRKEAVKEEKRELYTQIAKEIMDQDYWEPELKLWANYVIELTSLGDDYGINSSAKATAVRINKHLFTQLHYDSIEEAEDTDEDWED
ncbi:MAG: beta family protein [Halobacteriovoraceae bacterium]|nr:beta family protein [Halobacteriovoraceae bacterium]